MREQVALLDITNPNRWHLDIQELTFSVSVDDVHVGGGAARSRITLAGGDCATVQLPLDVNWIGLGRTGWELRRGSVEYRVRGQITVGTPLGVFRRSYDRKRRFSLLESRPPGERLCGPQVIRLAGTQPRGLGQAFS